MQGAIKTAATQNITMLVLHGAVVDSLPVTMGTLPPAWSSSQGAAWPRESQLQPAASQQASLLGSLSAAWACC